MQTIQTNGEGSIFLLGILDRFRSNGNGFCHLLVQILGSSRLSADLPFRWAIVTQGLHHLHKRVSLHRFVTAVEFNKVDYGRMERRRLFER